MRSPTVKEVAHHAGVSIATVSRVLNGIDTVDGELRQRVMKAVEHLQYRHNRAAINLRTRSTKMVAIVVPAIENPFFVAVARAFEREAFKHGYACLVCNTEDDLGQESRYFQLLNEEGVAGLVVCATDERATAQTVRKLLDKGVAIVALDRRLENTLIDSIRSDNFGGARTAVAHLIELGHTRIGLIAGPDLYAPARERRHGYEQALSDHGLLVDDELIKVTDFRDQQAEQATEELLTAPNRVTALFVSSGNTAIGSLRAITRLGFKMPDDLSLVVFDDLDWAAAYNPPITAVAQDTEHLGGLAGRLLLQRIQGGDAPPEERHLPTRLVVRSSTGSPPQETGRR